MKVCDVCGKGVYANVYYSEDNSDVRALLDVCKSHRKEVKKFMQSMNAEFNK